MNAIMSLCHFCENHGPSVIFCTHPFRPTDTQNVADDGMSADGSRDKHSRSSTSSVSGSDGHVAGVAAHRMKKPDTCVGCKSIQGGYTTYDEEAEVNYVSKQYPHHPLVFSMVRQACVRSLSCEVCPGREGPIFFGDEQRGHVISYTFYIKDSQSRGLHRWYSILVIMMDKVYLLNSWPFLVPNIQLVIENIQAKAKVVFDNEQAKCPQRPLRLQTGMTPLNFRQQRGISKSLRSLSELTNDKNVFKLLHVTFTWIIKACGNRITETLLEGPPTEDSIIDMEKQEETEEGFIKLFSKKLSMNEGGETGVITSEQASPTTRVIPPEPEGSQVQSIALLRKLIKILGQDQFHTITHHTVIGNQIIVRGDHQGPVAAILSAIKILLPKGCCRVIASSDRYEDSWRCNFLGVPLSVRVPKHVVSTDCFLQLSLHQKVVIADMVDVNTVDGTTVDGTTVDRTTVDEAKTVRNTADVNTTDTTATKPRKKTHKRVLSSESTWCNIRTTKEKLKDMRDDDHSMKQSIENEGAVGGTKEVYDLEDFDFVLKAPVDIPDKSPHILSAMEAALLNDNLTNEVVKHRLLSRGGSTPHVLSAMEAALLNANLTNEVVEHCLISLKEEWMNKVKVLFKFTKAGGGRSEEDTRKLIQVVGAGSEDMPLLKFWMTGLSVQYRTHILSASKHVPGPT